MAYCLRVNGDQPYRAVDLSYVLDNETTISWPGGEHFRLCVACSFNDKYGYHYAAGTFSMAEHTGTHVDAPFHFNADGRTVDNIPLGDLCGPCKVIDIKDKVKRNHDYCLMPEDISDFESEHGVLTPGDIVLIRTGWHCRYSAGPKSYLGFDDATDGEYDPETANLSFPGIGPEAARLLVSRQVAGVGLDTASLDPGSSREFIVHRILLGANVYGIENLNGEIDLLPATGATALVMPLRLKGGTDHLVLRSFLIQ